MPMVKLSRFQQIDLVLGRFILVIEHAASLLIESILNSVIVVGVLRQCSVRFDFDHSRLVMSKARLRLSEVALSIAVTHIEMSCYLWGIADVAIVICLIATSC